MDDSSLPPGRPVRLTLLTYPLSHLQIPGPPAPGCAACGWPWTAHGPRDPSREFLRSVRRRVRRRLLPAPYGAVGPRALVGGRPVVRTASTCR
jgi:hypothetical protein